MKELVPDYIRELRPYIPGKPVAEVTRELGLSSVIKLASNENPLGPPPKAIEAMKEAVSGVSRYPDSGAYYLREKLAKKLNVPKEQIIVGRGSCEIIDLAARAFVAPGEKIIISEGTFIMYPIAARMVNAGITFVPLRNYRYDLSKMAEVVDEKTKLIFIANPNNPTGTMIKADELDRFLRRLPKNLVVVLDEAYYEYVDDPDYPDSLAYVKEGRRVIVLRTFSKIYGLAGLRIGYGITTPELIEWLFRVTPPFNTGALAQRAAMTALDDEDYVEKTVRINNEGKGYLADEFRKLGISFVPSLTNFMLLFTPMDGNELAKALLQEGIIVRGMKGWGFENGLRVTIGAKEELVQFVTALRKVSGK
jgi:histidinol-phosphate aminotransferase